MIKKEGTKTCQKCLEKIDLKEHKFVLLGTYNNLPPKKDEEAYFHFPCFVDWYNQKVMEKARNQVKFMQQKALEVANHPMIKNALSQITGGQQIVTMLSTPLDEEPKADPVLKKLISQKFQNDGRKKRNKKRKVSLQKV